MIIEHRVFLSSVLLLAAAVFFFVLFLNDTASGNVGSVSAQNLAATDAVDTVPLEVEAPSPVTEAIDAVPLEVEESSPVTDAVDTMPLEVEEPSPVTEAIDTVPLEVEEPSPVTEAIDTVPLEVEEPSPVTEAIDTVPLEIEESSPVTDAVDTMPLEVEEPSPVTEAVYTVPLEVEEPSPVTEAVYTVPLEVEEPSPVTEAVYTVPLEVEEPSPVTEAINTVPLELGETSPVTEAVDTVPLELEETLPVTEAVETVPMEVEGTLPVTEAVDTMLPEVAHAMQPTSPVNTAPNVNHDDILHIIWEREPRFGGVWVDTTDEGKVLHVLLTGGEEGAFTATDRVHRAVVEIFGRSFDAVVREQADYTIGDLSGWHASLRERVWDIQEVISLDLDERGNRLRIGVEGVAGTKGRVYSLADDLQIPEEAIVVYEDEIVDILPPPLIPPELPSGDYAYATSSHNGTLREPLPPAVGGTQLTIPSSSCTLSFGVRLVGEVGIVTNSHCTEVQNALDGAEFLYTVDEELLAVETRDPGNTSDPAGIGRCEMQFSGSAVDKCRYSDAAYAKGAGEVPIAVGLIARPEVLYTGRIRPISAVDIRRVTAIDGDNPYFKIAGINSVLLGETVNKVGRTTGWTEGVVLETCRDSRVASFLNEVILCNTDSDFYSQGGDSGSPVFLRNSEDSDYVDLVGVHWGGNSSVNAFSPIDAVFEEVFPELSSEEERTDAVSYFCGRTREVLGEVLAIAGSANRCGEDLSLVTKLDLRDRDINILEVSEFSGLPNLERIDLSGNNLSSLTDEIFSGLPAGLEVYLHGNDASGEPLTPADIENLLEHLPHSAALYLDGGDANLSGFGSSAYEFRGNGFIELDINLGGDRPQNHETIVGRISLQPVNAELSDTPRWEFTFTFEGQGVEGAAFSPPRESLAYLAPPIPERFSTGGDAFIAGIEFVYEETGMIAFTADTPTVAITVNADLMPTFGASAVTDQVYTAGVQITSLTLPAAMGGDGSLTYSVFPALSEGLIFNPSTLQITGTPTSEQSRMTYTLTAGDTDGDTATLTFRITVKIDDGAYDGIANSILTAINLPLGGSSSGSLILDDIDFYRVVVTEPGSLGFFTTGSVDTIGQLQSSGGDELVMFGTGDDDGGGRNFRFEYFVQPGTYFLVVKGFSGIDEGPYTAHAAFVTGNDLIPTFGSIGIRDRLYTVGVQITSLDLPPAMGGNGSLTYSVFPALSEGLIFNPSTLQITGTPTSARTQRIYTLTARDIDGDTATLTFRITVIAGDGIANSISTAINLPLGGSSSGDLISDDVDFYRVVVTEPRRLVLFTTGSLDTIGQLQNSDGDELVRFRTGDDAGADFNFRFEYSAQPGTYFLAVTGFRSIEVGPYTAHATFEPDYNFMPSFRGTSVTDQVYTQGVQISSLTLPAAREGNGSPTYSLSPSLSAGLIFNPSTLQITGTPTSARAQTTYTLTARDTDGDTATLTFRITVIASDGIANSISTAINLTFGGSSSGSLISDDVDFYRVVVTEPGSLVLFTTGSIDTTGQLQNSGGDELVRLRTGDDAGTGFNFRFEYSAQPGTYFLVVTGYSSRVTGPYTVHATFVPDNDIVTVGFVQPAYRISENAGSVTLTVSVLSGIIEDSAGVTVSVMTLDGSATAGEDYSRFMETLTFQLRCEDFGCVSVYIV